MQGDQASPDFAFSAADTPLPPFVSLTPFIPSSRRLSSSFCEPSRPVSSSRRLSWVSLQGRLVGASEATSAKAIGGGLSPEEAVAWEVFTPMQRVLIVAVVAVAVADLKKSRQVAKLQRSVEIRDEILANMQQKLDDLCEQINMMKDRTETCPETLFSLYFGENDGRCNLKNPTCESRRPSIDLKKGAVDKDDIFKKPQGCPMGAEQEERRMSELSDWCSSVTSSAEIQLSSPAVDQDIYNLRKECEEKDVSIKELAAVAEASDAAASQRIAELEEVIRRKNLIITKLKKDMIVLEQKVQQLTRLRRPSYSASGSNDMKIPAMAPNVLYDLDSSTSPSSSDSDAPAKLGGHRSKILVRRKPNIPDRDKEASLMHQDDACVTRSCRNAGKPPGSSVSGHVNGNLKQRNMSPLKEKNMNHVVDRPMVSIPKQSVSATGDPKRHRRRVAPNPKDNTPSKRWQ
ncbi:uncharacterized protein [Aristolochia californica]|uniref:uncharacterized protein n=1 Tax=Aristolochia californica TaxID=171875 RepID=UPI0035E2B488